MVNNNFCPECGASLNANTKRCSCGWHNIERRKIVLTDHRCWYTVAEMRCPLPSTMTPYLYGTGEWYCRRHYHTLNNPQFGKAELRYINENYQKIMNDDYRDWRKDLFTKFQ